MIAATTGGIRWVRQHSARKEQLLDDVQNSVKNIFREIRITKIPYLRQQKDVFLQQLRTEFDNGLRKTEELLSEALQKQKDQILQGRLLTEHKEQTEQYEELKNSAVKLLEE